MTASYGINMRKAWVKPITSSDAQEKSKSQHLQLTLGLETEETPGLTLLPQPGYWDLLHP